MTTNAGTLQAPLTSGVRHALVLFFQMVWGGAQGGVSVEDWQAFQRLCQPDLIIMDSSPIPCSGDRFLFDQVKTGCLLSKIRLFPFLAGFPPALYRGKDTAQS